MKQPTALGEDLAVTGHSRMVSAGAADDRSEKYMTRAGRPRVVHVSSAHPFTDNRIHYRECVSLADAGYDVSLIAVVSPIDAGATAVKVTTIPKRRRVARMLLSSAQAVGIALRSGADIVHLHDPELIPYIPLLRLARRFVVYDAHEDLPVQVLSKEYAAGWRGRVLSVAAKALVRISRLSNVTIAATEKIAERFTTDRTFLVHNYPPLREEESSTPERENIAIYIGGMSRLRGAVEVIEAAQSEQFPKGWTLHLAGSATPEITALIESANRDRVVFHGQLPPQEARDLLLRAKVGIVTFHDTPAHQDSLPTKMFEYFAGALPVIVSDFPLWRGIVGDAECGQLVDPSAADTIAAAVASYAADPQLREAHSANAREIAVTTLNWAPEAANLLRAYATWSARR